MSSSGKKRKSFSETNGAPASSPSQRTNKAFHHRIKVNIRLAENVPSADSEKQETANPLVVPPVLVSFPHGRPRQAETLTFRCRATDSKGGQRRRRLRLAGETPHVAYSAEQPAVAHKNTAKYMVGIYRENTQEVVLYPVEAIVALEQKVRIRNAAGELLGIAAGADDEEECGEEEEEEAARVSSYAERRKSLVDTFGTKKKRRVMQSQEENRISADAVVGLNALGGFLADSLKEVQKDAAEAKQTLTPAEASRATLLPPYNVQARSVDQVYLPRRMLGGEGVWDSVAQELEELLGQASDALAATAAGQGEDGKERGAAGVGGSRIGTGLVRETILKRFENWPAFVRQLIVSAPLPTLDDSIGGGGDDGGGMNGRRRGDGGVEVDPRKEHMCRLLLLRHLFELYRLPPMVRGGASSLSMALGLGTVNQTVSVVLLEHFFQSEGEGEGEGGRGGGFEERYQRHTRTKALTDKLLLHLLVLCLVVGGYRVSASRVALDLRMSVGECTTLFRETGATVRKVYGGAGHSGFGGQIDEEKQGEGGGGRKRGRGSGGGEVMVELLLPLKFPEVKRVIRAKK